ncbi:MAG: accessory gene regulator B family protein [Oscillospiraceae bacterium]|nr:accessory gene regulator B family protein [Oscillospiraceae bacterium]
MISAIASKITAYIMNNADVDKDMEEGYHYGAEIMVSTALNIMLILLCGLLFKAIPSSLIFLGIFIPLRHATGGYHANTYLTCNTAFVLTFLTVLLSARQISGGVNVYILAALLILGFLPVYLFAPVENPNKEISAEKAKKNRKTAMLLYAAICASVLSMSGFSMYYAAFTAVTLVAVSVLILIGFGLQKGKNNNI